MERRQKGIVVSLVLFAMLFTAIAPVQAVPYIVYGRVFDTDGVTTVDGVNVTVTSIETGESASYNTTRGGWYLVSLGNDPYPAPALGDTLQIVADAGDGRTNTTEVTATESPQIVDLVLQVAQNTTPPIVTNPIATPSSIPANGTATSQLNVTVTDASGVDSVTIDLSAIGCSATEIMYYLGDNVYSTETTAAVGTPSGLYNLLVNATDSYGNSNTSVSIPLDVTEPEPTVSIYTDKAVYYRGDMMHAGIEVTNPGSDLPVRFAVWLEDTGEDTHVLTFTSLTLPSGLEYSNPDFAVFTVPNIPAGTYTWNAAIIEPYGPMEFISHDTAEWEFVSGVIPTEDITTVLEQVMVVIDFGE